MIGYELSKVNLPYSRDVAEALLAEAIKDPAIIAEHAGDTSPDIFLDVQDRGIWCATLATYERHGTVSPELIARELGDRLAEVGGIERLIELAEIAPYAAHYRGHVKTLSEELERRNGYRAHAERARVWLDTSASITECREFSVIPDAETASQRFSFQTSSELAQADIAERWHIHGVIPQGQPGVGGGGDKALKTTIGISAAMSICSGQPWCGHAVDNVSRTMILSAESGFGKLRRTGEKIARASGRNFSEYDILWSDNVADLTDAGTLRELSRTLARERVQFLLIDPAYMYLAELGDSSANIFKSGKILRGLTMLGKGSGTTVCLLHHFRKSGGGVHSDKFAIPELSWLSSAGFGSWARWWFLLNRRSPYRPDEAPLMHQLWGVVGGSSDHAHTWGIDVDEGGMDGRQFSIDIRPAGEVIEEQQEESAAKKAAKEASRPVTSDTHDSQMKAVLTTSARTWMSSSKLSALAKLANAAGKASLVRLVESGFATTRPGRQKGSIEYLLSSAVAELVESDSRTDSRTAGQSDRDPQTVDAADLESDSRTTVLGGTGGLFSHGQRPKTGFGPAGSLTSDCEETDDDRQRIAKIVSEGKRLKPSGNRINGHCPVTSDGWNDPIGPGQPDDVGGLDF